MKFSVNKEWLVQQLENKLVRIVDCRSALVNSDAGKHPYEEGHIPGAVHFDLEKDLSGSVQAHGGRHPLPEVATFQEKLEKAGITNEMTVVAYDDENCAHAARFWWLLSYLGHERVFVLDGGYKEWTDCDFPITAEVLEPQKSSYQVDLQHNMLVHYEEVREVAEGKRPHTLLVDARAPERYRGEVEPIDAIPGRIPSSINYPWEKNLHEGSFKNEQALKDHYADLDPTKPVIVYCGSGITATPSYVALKAAGFQDVKLYAGSYSDWISYEDSPLERDK